MERGANREANRLTRRRRWQLQGHSGVTVWFTGLPASGKSTLAHGVERTLLERGRPAYALDAEELRRRLMADLEGEQVESPEEVRRVSELAAVLADAGLAVLVAIVSPRRADRAWAREAHERTWLSFLEVHVSTALEVCQARDPKGRYQLARQGRIRSVVGVDIPYEPPVDPELTIDTAACSPQAATDFVMRALGLTRPSRS